jgi:hypothetical protein
VVAVYPRGGGADPLGVGRDVLGPDTRLHFQIVAKRERRAGAGGLFQAAAVGAVDVGDGIDRDRAVVAVVGKRPGAVGQRETGDTVRNSAEQLQLSIMLSACRITYWVPISLFSFSIHRADRSDHHSGKLVGIGSLIGFVNKIVGCGALSVFRSAGFMQKACSTCRDCTGSAQQRGLVWSDNQ